MKESDLRIGNIIKIDGIICKVDARTLFDFNHDGRKKEGVPLTDEALIRAGFEKRLYGDYETFTNPDYKFVFIEKIGDYYFISGGYKTKKLQFIHELQNAHFYLFGQELKIL